MKEESSKILYDTYISSGHFMENTNVSKKRLRKEFNGFDKNILPELSKERSISVLEIGFGTGYFLRYLLKNGYNNFWGIEVGKEQYAFALKHVTNRIELVGNPLNYLEKHQKSFDIIIMLDVMEHIPKNKVIQYFKAIYGSLKAEGRLILRVPNGSNPFNMGAIYHDFTHETVFTMRSINQIGRSIGFADIKEAGFKEETLTLHGKFTTLSQTIIFYFMNVVIRLQRLHFDNSPLHKNIMAVLRK